MTLHCKIAFTRFEGCGEAAFRFVAMGPVSPADTGLAPERLGIVMMTMSHRTPNCAARDGLSAGSPDASQSVDGDSVI